MTELSYLAATAADDNDERVIQSQTPTAIDTMAYQHIERVTAYDMMLPVS